MKNKVDITAVLDYFKSSEDKPLTFDEDAIALACLKDNYKQSLAIKIVSVFGGLLASLAFIGFIFMAGIFDSGLAMLVFGGICIGGSILANKVYDKIIIDTVSVSFFVLGFMLIGFGWFKLNLYEDAIYLIFIIVALGSLCIVQNYILSFVAVLIINGSILTLIISHNGYELIHIYIIVLAFTMTYVFLKEAKIITTHKALSKLYNPVKTALIFSFLPGLIFLGKKGIFPISPDYIWLSPIVIISIIVYMISRLIKVFNITETKHKISIYFFSLLSD